MGERQFPDPIYDGDFAALYGLPADTKIIGPPMSGTLLTKTPDGNNPLLKYDGPWPPPKKEAEKPAAQPLPAAADPAPPEIIPDDSKALAVCLSPDVCKSPDKPVPYMSWGKASDNLNYSPDVRSNGMIIKRQDSKFFRCYGDEPGVGLGCKSGTVGDVVVPVTSSGIVRANGIWVQRHNDRCTLNNGNTEGEYVYVQSTEAKKAPDGNDKDDKAWYEKAWDWTSQTASDAGKAVGQWVEEHPRTMGAVQAVGGAFEAVGSSALIVGGTAADATVVGAPLGVAGQAVGVAGLINASDNVSTGLRQMWYGKPQETATVQATGAVVSALGGTPGQVKTAKTIASGGQMILGGVAGAGSILKQTGQTAARTAGAMSDDLARAEAGTVAKEAGEAAESTAKVGGEQGARSTKAGSYKEMRKQLKGTGEQANHMNQDAAFRDVIPSDQGIANAMKGNAFKDVGSPHYEFHKSLEGFWDQYRAGGSLEGAIPTVSEYDSALRQALRAGGYTPAEVDNLAGLAAQNRGAYGLNADDFVPRVPGRINQSK